MPQLKITRTAFNNMNMYCGDVSVSNVKLSQPDMFLPILLLLLEKTLSNKVLLDKMVSYDLVFNKNSLFYIEAKNIHIKNADEIINTLNQMKGVESILALFDLLDDNDVEQNRYDLKRMCEYIRGKLFESGTDKVFDKNTSFEFLFDHITTPSLSETFLNEQNQLLNNSLLFDVVGTAKNELETKDKGVFLITDTYPQLCAEDKKIFDELAVLACSNYLCENSKKTNITDIDNDVLLPVDELILFAAILNHKVILDKIANHFNCQHYQVVFDNDVYALREKLKSTATTRSFDSNGTSITWYMLAKKYAVNLQLNTSISECFNASIENNRFNVDCFVAALTKQHSQRINEFIQMNQHGNNTVKTAIASNKIQKSLNNRVIGQEAAVSSLCQGYLTSSIEAANGPRSIYTFAGPSGVGKTYLASQLQSQLNEFEQSGYLFTTFNMEQYSDERDAKKLFGSGIQYVDSSLGMLTFAVRAQPRQVLLFDEIEKADGSVIQSLLSVLDSGLTKDQTSQEEIDFSQCIIIFTTNLGQDVLQSNPQNSALSIFDLLRQSENPSNRTKLSPEFINRLAKGFPILFSELKVNHLVRLAEMQVNQLESSSAQISYNWPHNFASLMLQSMSPDISVRALKSNFAKHKSMILSRATPYFTEDDLQVKFQVNIEQTEIDLESRPVQLLLLDDDSNVFEQVKAHQADCGISLCADVVGLRHAIESCHPDALLIDIETINKNNIQLGDAISELFARNNKTPIFTYQLVGANNKQIEQNSAHEVREHFRLNINDFSASFTNMLTRVNYYLDTEHKIFNMKRRNEQLQYQCEVIKQGDIFQANYKQLSVTQLVQSSDLKEGELFKHSLPTLKLDDVIGLDRAKKRLVDVVNWLKSPEKLANFGVKVPSGFLFAGPPGTGKTFLAKALAGESGLPFFSVSSSELSDSHAGGTTQNIKKLFATARKYAPSIIFIDEIDAIAGKRSSSSQGADRDRNLTVNALLTEMDGFTPQSDPIFILAATNYPQLLDSAIVRPGRFDETIYCELPNVEARKQFFTRFSKKHQVSFTDEEVKQLISSSQGMSSAEIEQVFREAIYQAVGENKALTSEEIKQTMIRVSYGLPSDHIVLSKQEKLRTAYHEAGHLLLTKLLFPKQPIDFVTIEPRNNALGFVATRAADEYESLSSIRVKHRLEVLLAGRVAEKIYTGSVDEISSGASGDIEKATQLAMHVIYEGGLDAAVGPVNVGLLTKFEESDLLLKAQSAVQRWLLEAEKSVEARLIEHREQLDHIANTLVDKESLIGEEIERLFFD
jgi:cell division protease FtsH